MYVHIKMVISLRAKTNCEIRPQLPPADDLNWHFSNPLGRANLRNAEAISHTHFL